MNVMQLHDGYMTFSGFEQIHETICFHILHNMRFSIMPTSCDTGYANLIFQLSRDKILFHVELVKLLKKISKENYILFAETNGLYLPIGTEKLILADVEQIINK